VGILVDGITLAGAAWHIALIVQRPVTVCTSTRLGTVPIATASATDPTTRFSLVIVGTTMTLATLGRISRDTSMVGISVAVALC
jgi:hypothetical protein